MRTMPQPSVRRVTRPSMRFVPVKSTEQQAALALHRRATLLVKQRTQLVNMIRGLLAEFGIEMARGLRHALELAARLSAGDAAEVPPLAQRKVTGLADQIGALQIQLTRLEKELLAWYRESDLSQRLATIPGVGIVSATALAASVSEPERFRSGRQFAASLGLTPLHELQWWQGAPGPDLAHGRPLFAPAARSRHDLSDPACEDDTDLGRPAAAGAAAA